MLLIIVTIVKSQNPKQAIRGRVLDADTHQSLPGVNVVILDTDPPIGVASDTDGYYIMENVTPGRYQIQFSFIGYEPALFRNIVVGSAKEVALNAQLKEKYKTMDEVVVKAGLRKDKAQNVMATLSARTFSVEEASRYAGGWNDPSRLAGSFAGVSMAEGVNDNAIVIRGNSPNGILWQLEGVEIPAPNHLNGVNNGGGIETVFSVNMLDNSDFYTGAFPAEYSNAISGVFDMQFRNGNNRNYEHIIQIGSQGIDVGSEGPFKKGGRSSYLFNYRYSTMGIAGEIVDGNFGMPTYQDLSFKLNFPLKKGGEISYWGIGGVSSVAFDPDKDTLQWENTFDNNQYSTGSKVAVSGINYKANVSSWSYFKLSAALTYDHFVIESEQLNTDGRKVALANHIDENVRFVANTYLNSKLSKHITNRTGVRYKHMSYAIDVNGNPNPEEQSELILIANQSGVEFEYGVYSQSKWRMTSTIDINVGFNIEYYNVSKETLFEPRGGITWRFIPKHSFAFSFGKHSRAESLRFYQATKEDGTLLNSNLKVTKADHIVFSYDYIISPYMKLEIEPYYQYLYDLPIIEGTTISLLNYEWDMYFSDPLVNKGEGKNVGIDLTLERYMKNGLYYMSTASVFDSKYFADDGKEYNTSFNRNFVINILGGKEFELKNNKSFSVNGKLSFMGGNRFTPPNQSESKENQMVVLDELRPYEWQEDNKLFFDLALNYRVNKSKSAHVIGLQAKNLLLQSEMFGWAYDFEKQKVVEHGLTMVYPYFNYKIEF